VKNTQFEEAFKLNEDDDYKSKFNVKAQPQKEEKGDKVAKKVDESGGLKTREEQRTEGEAQRDRKVG